MQITTMRKAAIWALYGLLFGCFMYSATVGTRSVQADSYCLGVSCDYLRSYAQAVLCGSGNHLNYFQCNVDSDDFVYFCANGQSGVVECTGGPS